MVHQDGELFVAKGEVAGLVERPGRVLLGGMDWHCRSGALVAWVCVRHACFSFWKFTNLLGLPGALNKQASDMRGKWCINKNTVQEFLHSVFLHTISPHVWDFVFFQNIQNGKCSRYPSMLLFRTRVMDTH